MSIIKAVLADSNNRIKDKWVVELKIAYENQDWDAVKIFLDKLEKFHWGE